MKKIITASFLFAGSAAIHGQMPITGVYTNYGGFWSSTILNNSPVKPDSSHMLLGFTYNGSVYSTGVANNVLLTNGVTFSPGTFQSFQIPSGSIFAGGTAVIGVGNLYGGGPGNVLPLPVTNDMAVYLSDGTQGLDMGTAVFNIPSSDVNFPVNNFIASALSDGIPDIIVTQVGQPPAAGSLDSFQFENSAGTVVGNPVAISLSGINVLGTGYWKFYNPTNPPTYNAGNLGDRPLRMVGFELSDFGLTTANVGTIVRFVHKLSGNSDQAFIAYNTAAFTASTGVVLPIALESFVAAKLNGIAVLDWSVGTANKFSHFELERSYDNLNNFVTIYSTPLDNKGPGGYRYQDRAPFAGKNYYRLKMVDQDGSAAYSAVRMLDFALNASFKVYPNPVSDVLKIQVAKQGTTVAIYDIAGKEVFRQLVAASQLDVNVCHFSAGIYTIRISSEQDNFTQSVIVKH